MGFCRPILHAFRYRIRLVPDDLAAQKPAVRPESKCEHPRNADEILGLASRWKCFLWSGRCFPGRAVFIERRIAEHFVACHRRACVGAPMLTHSVPSFLSITKLTEDGD